MIELTWDPSLRRPPHERIQELLEANNRLVEEKRRLAAHVAELERRLAVLLTRIGET